MKNKIKCVYQIRNKENGKVYVGSTINYKTRTYQHKNNLKNNRHSNKDLQKDYNKYGKEKFVFEILEEVDKKEDLKIKERKFLKNKSDFYNRRNICLQNNGEKYVKLMVYIDYEQLEVLDKISEETKTPKTELIRNAVDEYMGTKEESNEN